MKGTLKTQQQTKREFQLKKYTTLFKIVNEELKSQSFLHNLFFPCNKCKILSNERRKYYEAIENL